jgi:peptidoglycan/xylan/chitin deacetylase (PgdA/CDA1 family)
MDGNPEISPALLARGLYGARVGVPRILRVLEEYGVKATFFVPGYVAERHREAVEAILCQGHEIGCHGYLHEPPGSMSPDQEERVLEKSIAILERICGKRPAGYRSPSWDFSRNTLSLLSRYGFLYDSSLMLDEKPVWMFPEAGGNPVLELPVEWCLDDAPYFLFNFDAVSSRLYPPAHILDIWLEEFSHSHASSGCFIMTMHPQISGRPHRVTLLRKLIEFVLLHDVWVAPLAEVASVWANACPPGGATPGLRFGVSGW